MFDTGLPNVKRTSPMLAHRNLSSNYPASVLDPKGIDPDILAALKAVPYGGTSRTFPSRRVSTASR